MGVVSRLCGGKIMMMLLGQFDEGQVYFVGHFPLLEKHLQWHPIWNLSLSKC